MARCKPFLEGTNLCLAVGVWLLCGAGTASGSEWIRPTTATAALTWGRSDGIVFGLPSKGGMPGPRGLIRVGLPPEGERNRLINYIAIEPVAAGAGDRFKRMAFSELEKSQLDPGKDGKRLWVEGPAEGELVTSNGLTSLRVRIAVEKFIANSAHVYLIASVRNDHPEELRLEVHNYEDSAPLEELTVTATMGNYERLRQLWFKDRVVESTSLYSGYTGRDFVEKAEYPLDQLLDWNGSTIALATPSEADPAAVQVAKPSWTYRHKRLTQYWRVEQTYVQPGLRARVNGRRVYWLSNTEIPGGPAFENFELRQKYAAGQEFIFGLTPRLPKEFTPAIKDLVEP